MKIYLVKMRWQKEEIFQGTNDDYLKFIEFNLKDLEGFVSSGNIEDDYFRNNFVFGDSGDYEIITLNDDDKLEIL